MDLTARQGYRLPLGPEQFTIDHQNFNWNKADLLSGVTVCTSSTRPNTPSSGMLIYESDTGHMWIWRTDLAPAQWYLITNGLRGGKRYDTAGTLATLAAASAGTEALAGMDTGTIAMQGSRMHRVRARVEVASSIAGDSVTLRVRTSNVTGAVWAMFTTGALRAANVKEHVEFEGIVATGASPGNILFVVTAQRASGTGAITITSTVDVKPFVIVEQLAPAASVTVV